MPRFFFDIADGALTVDEQGTDFPNIHAARAAAMRVLPNVARDDIAKGHGGEIVVLMRDAAGRALFTASLTITARWLVDTA